MSEGKMFNIKKFESASELFEIIAGLDNEIYKIIKLKKTANPETASWNSVKAQLKNTSVKNLNSILNLLAKYLDEKFMPEEEGIQNYLKSEIQKIRKKNTIFEHAVDTEEFVGRLDANGKKTGYGYYCNKVTLLGNFKNDLFLDGLALYGDNSFYYGKFNKTDNANPLNSYEFKGIFYKDYKNEEKVNIGIIRFGHFRGIQICLDETGFSAFIKTDHFTVKLPNINFPILSIMYTNPEEENRKTQKFVFKQECYLISVSSEYFDCFLSLSSENDNVISYQCDVNDRELKSDTVITLLFPNNNVYIGKLDPDNCYEMQDDNAKYIIREPYRSDPKYLILGKFDNGHLIEGKVYEGEGKKILFEGTFKDDEPSEGKFYFGNGDVYEGEISQFKLEGEGKYSFKNGELFSGSFKENFPRGKGNFKDYVGKEREIDILPQGEIYTENE